MPGGAGSKHRNVRLHWPLERFEAASLAGAIQSDCRFTSSFYPGADDRSGLLEERVPCSGYACRRWGAHDPAELRFARCTDRHDDDAELELTALP